LIFLVMLARPDVVLVGTSNSNGAMDFNFAGFLEEYLGHEVANLARSGGGYDGAIMDYLASEAFTLNPPTLLIWEVPGYYSLNTASYYERLLASVGG
jgi:alginate biosynthesis protein AlgX